MPGECGGCAANAIYNAGGGDKIIEDGGVGNDETISAAIEEGFIAVSVGVANKATGRFGR